MLHAALVTTDGPSCNGHTCDGHGVCVCVCVCVSMWVFSCTRQWPQRAFRHLSPQCEKYPPRRPRLQRGRSQPVQGQVGAVFVGSLEVLPSVPPPPPPLAPPPAEGVGEEEAVVLPPSWRHIAYRQSSPQWLK